MKLSAIIIAISTAAAGAAIGYGLLIWPKDRAKDAVRAILKDPDSAKFKDVQYNRKTGVSCGVVNAKNSMGGYVGDRAFVVEGGGSLASLEPDAPTSYDKPEDKIMKEYESRRFKEMLVVQCLGGALSPLDSDQCPLEVPGCSWGKK